MRGRKPYLGLDPALFEEFGAALQEEEGVDFYMDPVTNIPSIYNPNFEKQKDSLKFFLGLWGIAVKDVQTDKSMAFFKIKERVLPKDAKERKRMRLARQLCDALDSLDKDEVVGIMKTVHESIQRLYKQFAQKR